MLGEVEGVTRDLVHWRHTVDLQERTCTCRRWQVTGLPCTHALCIITSIRGYNIEDYVHDYYSVAKFKKAYGKSVKPITDRKQWPQVDSGFKLWPPILKRAAGRPRKRMFKSAAEGALKKPQNIVGATSLDIWQKLAMNIFMILMHHHLPLQSQREREARKMSQ